MLCLKVRKEQEKRKAYKLNLKDNRNKYKVKNRFGWLGDIISKNDDSITIKWNNDTTEFIRFAVLEKDYLTYVDSTENIVNPLGPKSSDELTTEANVKGERKVNDNIDTNTNTNDIYNNIDINTNTDNIDLEKEQLKKEIRDLKNDREQTAINKVKKTAAEEIVDLAISKGMIAEDEKDLELLKVTSFSDEDFKQYENSVINYNIKDNVESLKKESIDTTGMSKKQAEAYEMLQRIKSEGGVTYTGDFSYTNNNETRILKDVVEKNDVTFDNIGHFKKPESLEEALLKLDIDSNDKILNDKNFNNKSFKTQDTQEFNDLEDSFQEDSEDNLEDGNIKTASHKLAEPLTGITKPLLLGQEKSGFQALANSPYNELLGGLDWTVLSKK